MVGNIALQGSQRFVTSGATGKPGGLVVTRKAESGPHTVFHSLAFDCNVNEADTRLWLHAKHATGPKIFILSPDTDTYHIGLPLVRPADEVMVQISKLDKELNLLHLHSPPA